MGDDIRAGIPLSGKDYTAEPVYHVKPVDADGQRNSREQFEDQLKRQKGEEGPDNQKLPPSWEQPTGGIPEEIKDGLILSEQAKQMLDTKAPSTPVASHQTTPPQLPEAKPAEKTLPPIVQHIDLKA
jgi:hypothetical protein